MSAFKKGEGDNQSVGFHLPSRYIFVSCATCMLHTGFGKVASAHKSDWRYESVHSDKKGFSIQPLNALSCEDVSSFNAVESWNCSSDTNKLFRLCTPSQWWWPRLKHKNFTPCSSSFASFFHLSHVTVLDFPLDMYFVFEAFHRRVNIQNLYLDATVT